MGRIEYEKKRDVQASVKHFEEMLKRDRTDLTKVQSEEAGLQKQLQRLSDALDELNGELKGISTPGGNSSRLSLLTVCVYLAGGCVVHSHE